MRLSFERERRRMESDKANEIQVAVRECKKKQWVCSQKLQIIGLFTYLLTG